jgi:uncharacterized membrane protein YeaQ/YmgE (transglycosylase-associated protein family)
MLNKRREKFMNFIIWLASGIAVGWLASNFFGKTKSLITYLGIGIVGSMLGGLVFGLLNINFGGVIGSFVTSVIGAILLLFLLKEFGSKKS